MRSDSKYEPVKWKKKSKTSCPIFEKIERICTHPTMETSIATSSTKKQAVSPWVAAPGTPVSEAWETLSGPMASRSPIATPIRKVVLKLPKAAIPSQRGSVEAGSIMSVPPLPSNKAPKLDIEHRLISFSNSILSEADDELLIKECRGLFGDFSVESVAASQWLLQNAGNILSSSKFSTSFKQHVFGLLMLQLGSLHNLSGFTSLTLVGLEYLANNVMACALSINIWQSISGILTRIPIEEGLLLKLASSLLQSCLKTGNMAQIQLVSSLAFKNDQVKELVVSEILSNQNSDSGSIVICSVVQYELLQLPSFDETASKKAFESFFDSLYRRLSGSNNIGSCSLVPLIKGIIPALRLPELPCSVIFSKMLANFALLLLISGEKGKLETSSKLSIIEALTILGNFLRPFEIAQVSQSFDIQSYLVNSFICINLRPKLATVYESIYENSSKELDSKIEAHISQLVNLNLNDLSSIIVTALVRLISDSSLQIRTKSMKGLLSVLQPNDRVFENSSFCEFILGKLHDSSVTIRDTTLELLSRCWTVDSLGSMSVLDKLSVCLHDSSSAVQRRAIRVYRELLVNCEDLDTKATILGQLLRVFKIEDDSIATLSFKVLRDHWLQPFLQRLTGNRQELTQFVTLLIRLIRFLSPDTDCVQLFFSKSREEPLLKSTIYELCTPSVDILFESLITSIEGSNWEAVSFILNTILIFVGQEHDYLSPHIRLLFELTKSHESNSVESALKLLNLALINAEKAALMQLHDFFPHLSKLIIQGSEQSVKESVEILSRICSQESHLDDFKKYLWPLWNKFLTYLESRPKDLKVGTDHIRPTSRALLCIGSISSLNSKYPDAFVRSMDLIQKFTANENPSVQFYAIQALVEIIIRNSSITLRPEISDIIRRSFSFKRSAIDNTLLNMFLKLLVDSREAQETSFDKSMQSSNLTTLATIVQSFVKDIVRASNTPNQECQHVSVRLMSKILVGGHCHPHQVIPAIVALSSSHSSKARAAALDVLKTISETHSTFLLSNYSLTLRSIYDLQNNYDHIQGFYEDRDALKAWISPLYEELCCKKSKREDFFTNIIREFLDYNQDTKYLVFIIETLGTLPLKTLEEAVHLFRIVCESALSISSAIIESANGTDIEMLRAFLLLALRNHIGVAYNLTAEYTLKF